MEIETTIASYFWIQFIFIFLNPMMCWFLLNENRPGRLILAITFSIPPKFPSLPASYHGTITASLRVASVIERRVREGGAHFESVSKLGSSLILASWRRRVMVEAASSGGDAEGAALLLPESGERERSWRLNFEGFRRSERKEKPSRRLQRCLGVFGSIQCSIL